MRILHHTAAWGIAVAVALLAGCASEKKQEAALARLGDEAPPDFLAGPASIALTNFDGFSANVVSTTSAAASVSTGTRRSASRYALRREAWRGMRPRRRAGGRT